MYRCLNCGEKYSTGDMLRLQNGGTFRLSGRKSIHNHCTDCPFWKCEAMGRYGVGSNNRQEQGMCSTSQEGKDEVDNVMSKLARASSPIATRKNENFRRNSYTLSNHLKQHFSEDSDEDSNLLSKSSPAFLSSYSCCSEEGEGEKSTNSNDTTNSSFSRNQQNVSRNHSPSHLQNRRREIDEANYTLQEPKKSSNNMLFGIVIAVIIVLVSIFIANPYNIFKTSIKTTEISYDKYSFYNDVNSVGNKYRVSDNSILQVRAGIATIFEREDTGSFIFAYNSHRRDFNTLGFNNFVNELASATAKYLRNHTKTIQHVVVDTSNLQIQTDKELMNEYVEDVDKNGVMLVKDLDRVPSAVAMAFHYYCDEFNPLVKKSAIFFTLNMASCSNVSSDKYDHKNIEKCLADKWVKVPQDNIRPLLNRVVNVVIDVTRDFLN